MAKACAYLCRQCCFIDGFGEFGENVCKREIVISKAKPQSAGISFRANGAQLAHYKLGCHKSSIRPRSSVAYMSPIVNKTV